MKIIEFILVLLASLAYASTCLADTFYISPRGRDMTSGRSEQTPFRTFAHAFKIMSDGKEGNELVLLDGVYSNEAETGLISYDDGKRPWCGQPPSGKGLGAETIVRANNPGKVTVMGGLFLGRSFRKDSYIKIQGIKFIGESNLFNTSYITIKDCGFYSDYLSGGAVFFVGTNDHNKGNTYNLIEDCWIWGKERIIAANYRSDNNVWRRVVIRGDGCNSKSGTGSGNPNVGFTIYESQNCSAENVIVVDRILDGGSPYADFATAQHTEGKYYLGPNEWLGCISLKSPDSGFYFEADNANDFTHTIRNIIAWDSGGVNIDVSERSSNIVVENITAGITGKRFDSIRIAPHVRGGVIRNIISFMGGRYGINSSVQPIYSNVFESQRARYNQTQCVMGDKTLNPLKNGKIPVLKYLVRIEEGSSLKGTGYEGRDYGANVIKRYGIDGSRYGEPGYNTLTNANLWPWPNEDRIKEDMSSSSKRGFCADNMTLTRYIWEYLGNKMPEGIYQSENKEQNE